MANNLEAIVRGHIRVVLDIQGERWLLYVLVNFKMQQSLCFGRTSYIFRKGKTAVKGNPKKRKSRIIELKKEVGQEEAGAEDEPGEN